MRYLPLALLIIFAAPALAEPQGGATGGDGEAVTPAADPAGLKTADDWYDCAAYLDIVVQVQAGKGRSADFLNGLIEMRDLTQAMGDRLTERAAAGADGTSPDPKQTAAHGYKRVFHFKETQMARMNESAEAAKAHALYYFDRCMPAARALAAAVRERAAEGKQE